MINLLRIVCYTFLAVLLVGFVMGVATGVISQ